MARGRFCWTRNKVAGRSLAAIKSAGWKRRFHGDALRGRGSSLRLIVHTRCIGLFSRRQSNTSSERRSIQWAKEICCKLDEGTVPWNLRFSSFHADEQNFHDEVQSSDLSAQESLGTIPSTSQYFLSLSSLSSGRSSS